MSGPEIRRRLVALAAWCGAAACVVTSLWVYVGISDRLRGNEAAPWMLARASGFTSYLLMMSLVLVGLLLAHPGATRLRGLNRATRLRIHIALATFTLAFTTLHVVVLALDPFAGLGWRGALLPMAAGYRPVAVTLGVLAVWSALLSGLTAALAGRLTLRIWWPIHKVAVVAFGLAWAHGLLAGTDTAALTWCYLSTGMLVLLIAVSRYLARTPDDDLADLVDDEARLVGAGDGRP